jgi:hypothetical protein
MSGVLSPAMLDGSFLNSLAVKALKRIEQL